MTNVQGAIFKYDPFKNKTAIDNVKTYFLLDYIYF